MLTSSELIEARSAVESTMDSVVQIKKPTKVADGYGGKTTGWVVARSVKARIQPKYVQDLRSETNRLITYSHLPVLLPWNTDVSIGDRVAVGETEWQVVAVSMGGELLSKQVVCEAVNG